MLKFWIIIPFSHTIKQTIQRCIQATSQLDECDLTGPFNMFKNAPYEWRVSRQTQTLGLCWRRWSDIAPAEAGCPPIVRILARFDRSRLPPSLSAADRDKDIYHRALLSLCIMNATIVPRDISFFHKVVCNNVTRAKFMCLSVNNSDIGRS